MTRLQAFFGMLKNVEFYLNFDSVFPYRHSDILRIFQLIWYIIACEFRRFGNHFMWLLFAILSSVFAALTSILAKVGIENVNSNLATAIRTCVVLIMSWLMVFVTHSQNGVQEICRRSWLFLILSGLATGLSWLCYYKALQTGDVSKVVPIDKCSVILTLVLSFLFLHEQFTLKSLIGCLLIGAGTFVMIL